jgi:hypothetical protein
MAYGHAERTLATIRLLETETAALLRGLPWLDVEQSAWLYEVNGTGLHTADPSGIASPAGGSINGSLWSARPG